MTSSPTIIETHLTQLESYLNSLITTTTPITSIHDETLLTIKQLSRNLTDELYKLVEDSLNQTTRVNEKSLVLESILKEKEIILTELAACTETPITNSIEYDNNNNNNSNNTDTTMMEIIKNNTDDDDDEIDIKTLMDNKLKRVGEELHIRQTLKTELDNIRAKRTRLEDEHKDILLKCQAAQKLFKTLIPHTIQPIGNFLKSYHGSNNNSNIFNVETTNVKELHHVAVPLQNIWFRLKVGDFPHHHIKKFETMELDENILIIKVVSVESSLVPSSTTTNNNNNNHPQEEEEKSLTFRYNPSENRVLLQESSLFEKYDMDWIQEYAGLTTSTNNKRVSVKWILEKLFS
jgi:hypothetical protein